jgi:DTW domain-containing protein YfiP
MLRGPMELATEPRPTCERCRRPASVCYCAHLTSIPTKTRIAFLQHPRERDMAIGTARMASLCLPSSQLHVGVQWSGSSALASALGDATHPAALLYPGEGATDVSAEPPSGPITLVVIDGTWSQTKKMLKLNPELAALPRYSFVPKAKSEYRIRREPDDAFVSTIEALVNVLGALEGEPDRFAALLVPFRAMIDAQIDHQRNNHTPRIKRAREKRETQGHIPAVLREQQGDVVCIVAEGNAWKYGSPERPKDGASHAGEIVRLVAVRLGTGEVFDSVIAPRLRLAPTTAFHVGLTKERLEAGVSLDAFRAAWSAFLRPSDVLCTWGHHTVKLVEASGAALPRDQVDLRRIARAIEHAPVGAIDDYASKVGVTSTPLAEGRGGVRVAVVASVARYFAARAQQPRPPRVTAPLSQAR